MDKIFQGGAVTTYKTGALVPADNFVYLVKSGLVAIYSLRGGRRTFLFMYRPGEIFPLSKRAQKNHFDSYQFVAMSRTTLKRLPRSQFEKELDKFGAARSVIDSLLRLVEVEIERLEGLSQRGARRKVIERLNFLAERAGKRREDKILIESMTHADIASSIGTTRETVTRTIKSLEREGLLLVRRRGILILSPQRLKEMAAS